MCTEIKGKVKMNKAITMLSRGNEAKWKLLVNYVIPCCPDRSDGSTEWQGHLFLSCEGFLISLGVVESILPSC